MRPVALGAFALITLSASSLRAQIPVTDPANLQQTILIAERTFQHYSELRREYETLVRMGTALGNLGRLRVPSIPISVHDPSRAMFGRPWIQGLNSGDPTGAAYYAAALPLLRPSAWPAHLTAAARQAFERQYATVEIADSVATMGGHQVALARGYHGQLQKAVEDLEDDVMNSLPRYHEMTAVLDKISAGELLGRRQDMLNNQLLSHALEQLLARSKRQRDTEATNLNMQLTTWRDATAANHAFVAGTGDALRTWRQP